MKTISTCDIIFWTEPRKRFLNKKINFLKKNLSHRVGGPAIIIIEVNMITKIYQLNGKCHRLFSPAIIIEHNNKIIHNEWMINGNSITETVYEWMESLSIELDKNYEIPDDHKIQFKLLFY